MIILSENLNLSVKILKDHYYLTLQKNCSQVQFWGYLQGYFNFLKLYTLTGLHLHNSFKLQVTSRSRLCSIDRSLLVMINKPVSVVGDIEWDHIVVTTDREKDAASELKYLIDKST